MPDIYDVMDAIVATGGEAYIVGGAARDIILTHHTIRDMDIEVFGLETEDLVHILSKFGKVDLVGASFGVYLVKGIEFNNKPVEFALPRRREIRIGNSHTDFKVEIDPYMSFEDASRRRDLTINSLGIRHSDRKTIDYHGARYDWQNKIAREVDPNTFGDDDLRTLRAAQFIARFGLKPHPSLVACATHTSQKNISHERICAEWDKLLMLGVKPSLGVEFLGLCGWLLTNYYELWSQMWIRQNPEWHPEIRCLDHTLMVVDKLSNISMNSYDWQRALMYGALVHDCGKIDHTFFHKEKKKIVSYGHAKSELVEDLLEKITCEKKLYERALWIARTHMDKVGLSNSGKSQTFRKFARKAGSPEACETINMMFWADDQISDGDWNCCWDNSSAPMTKKLKAASDFVYAKDGSIRQPLTGKQIMNIFQIKQGPEVGKVMKRSRELFDDGKTEEEIVEIIRKER